MPSPSETRASLLIRIQDAGDERAWSEFMAMYAPLIAKFARRGGLQEADAADLAQDVFGAVAKAIRRWDPDRRRGSFRGWLFRVARNALINAAARRRRQAPGTGDSEVGLLIEAHPSPPVDEGSPELDDERRLFSRVIDRIKGDFKPATWEAFWRTSVDGEKPKDVADGLGLSVGAVYVAKNRVMARIRREIEGSPNPACEGRGDESGETLRRPSLPRGDADGVPPPGGT